MKKRFLKILIIFGIVLVILWLSGFLKIIYIYLNNTETTAEITQVKRTFEKTNSGNVYKIYVTYKTDNQEEIQTSFRETVDVYEADYYYVGNTISVLYSNWTPSVCLGQ
ncbi:DUF3592 domain-containing protein [Listeria sp. ILCC797]|uniref:DUF3592 domain-containing protein n=1 Tax=Listeria sp. ILCC797 TaxID=1918333 RepID=UPI000B597A9D|nr:DUF3592 domain-containing protein [Listeria sp. ILCC797]